MLSPHLQIPPSEEEEQAKWHEIALHVRNWQHMSWELDEVMGVGV